jgi:hypothetical protein
VTAAQERERIAEMNETTRETVKVMLTVGDQAELITPSHDATDPLRVPAAVIADDADLSVNELPGRSFTAVRDGDADTYRDFVLLDDPRR